MKLTPDQIDQLYTFTRQHYVEYYDLQTELVDHLANAIEEQWQENPKLSFDEALTIEFKKFGVFGFSDVVEKRHKTLSKKYFKLIWNHFVDFFKLPKIIGVFVLLLIAPFVLKVLIYIPQEIIFVMYIAVVMFVYYELYKNYKKRERNKKENKKRWLFKEIILGSQNTLMLFILPLQFANSISDKLPYLLNHPVYSILISSLLVFYGLFYYIIQNVIPAKAEEYLKQTYPEYGMAE